MKALHVIYSAVPEHGGAFHSMLGYLRAAESVGIETEVFSTDVADEASRVRLPVKVHYARSFRRSGYAVAPAMFTRLFSSAATADVIHVHGLWRFHSVAAAMVAKLRGVPCIVRTCGHLSPETFAYAARQKTLYFRAVEGRVLSGAARIHFTTEAEEQASQWIIKTKNSVVLPPPVDEMPNTDRSVARDRIGLSKRESLVVTVGRLDPIKGLEALISSLVDLAPQIKLAILGGDARGYRAVLERHCSAVGVRDRVRFVGHANQETLSEWLSAADLFVSASAHENFGLAIAEAAIAGTPVLLPEDLPIASQLGAGATQFSSREPKSLAQAITRSLASELRWSAAKRAQETARSLWSTAAVGPRLKKLYEEVASTSVRGMVRED